MDLIENMAASDIAILRDRVHIPTKKSLLELTSQDALFAQNKLLSKQFEALTETLSKLPTQIHSVQSLPFTVLQVAGCAICGGAHNSGCCIPNEETTHEVNYMGNQPRGNFKAGEFFGFQNSQQYQQQGQWRNHPGNQFNKDQGGPSTRPQQQGPSLYDRTMKLEETLAQFMQVSMSNHKSTKSAIKNLEVQLADRPLSSFSANTEKNPKEECKAVMTRSRMAIHDDKGRAEEKVEGYKKQSVAEPTLEPVSNFVELEEVVEDEDDQQERETPLKEIEGKEVPYPLVPSNKDKERHLARFLDIFKKLEITLPFGEALKQMPLYAKFLKDMLTKKNRYIHSDTIVVEGNCSVVIQRILPPKHKDPGSVTIPCSFIIWAHSGINEALSLIRSLVVDLKRANKATFTLKRKAPATPSQVRYEQSRFTSPEAWESYTDILVPRKLLPERNVVIYHTEFDEFKEELERRKWDEELTSFDESPKQVMVRGHLVIFWKEFYANIYDPEDKSPKQVMVRGHLVKFDVDTLNTFLKTPVIIEEGEELTAYSRFALLRLDPQELAAKLSIPGRGFELNVDGLPLKILRKNITIHAQTWSVLSYSNLVPTYHTFDITLDWAKLIYGIIMKMDMNMGYLISHQISIIAQHDSSRLGFPSLNHNFVVTSDSRSLESLSPAINLAYIKKNYCNLDDPIVTFRGPRKVRGKRSKAPSTSATPDAHAPSSSTLPDPSTPPISTPHLPSVPTPAPPIGPSSFTSETLFAMLQSLHKGQIIM
ncbi:hypothetical protein GmHk_18G052151 [Glycine max]|nr:hypothetical protein GmHk_18G052151 [Glycine max]